MKAPMETHDNARQGSTLADAPRRPARPCVISIIAACRNESKHIQVFLESLLSQDLQGFDWEIIVADGMSNDGTPDKLKEYARRDSRIAVIDNPARTVASGLNAAIRIARGEIILRMDAHTEYAPDYARKCVEALETTDADNVGGPARTKAEGLLACAIQAAYHSRFSTGGARFHDADHSGFVDTVPYGCWRKETLLKLGLFDEELVRNQDDELNLRLTRSGGKIWQSSEIVSWYRPRTTLSALFRQYFQYGFWKVRVIRKHRIPGSWRHLVPGAFVAANLLLLLAAAGLAITGSFSLSRKALLACGILLGIYALASLAASAVSARQNGWRLFPCLPLTFAVFHISYGLGFLIGSVYWTFSRSARSRLGDLFVGVTR
jgi:succinoglycan biosynthesis protein ExoA